MRQTLKKRTLWMMTLLGGVALAGTALADDDCSVSMAQWQPRSAVAAAAEAQGWVVRRIRTDDGCYKVYARDADGRRIEAEFDPATLALIEVEVEGYEDVEGDDSGGNGRDGRSSDDDGYEDDDEGGDDEDDDGDDEDDDEDDEGGGVTRSPDAAQPARPRNPLIGRPKAVID